MKRLFIDFEFNQTAEPVLNLVCCSYLPEGEEMKTVWLENDPGAITKLAKDLASYKDTHVFIAYAVEAEARSFLALGLNPLEFTWIDIYLEYRMLLNHNHKYAYGEQLISGQVKVTKPRPNKFTATEEELKRGHFDKPQYGLASACFKMSKIKIDTAHKDLMRQRIINGGVFSEQEKADIMRYCESDVEHLPDLFNQVFVAIRTSAKDFGNKEILKLPDEMFLRAEYSCLTALMVARGYPVNELKVARFTESAPMLLDMMKMDVATRTRGELNFNLFEKQKNGNIKFNQKKAQEYVRDKLNVDGTWMRTDKDHLSLCLEAFERQSHAKHDYNDSFVEQMLRFSRFKQSLNGFLKPTNKKRRRLIDDLGSDGRVRPYFGIYGAQSSRSQPGATSFIPLKAAWMRSMIEPKPGRWCCGVDYASQEFLISALLSGDSDMRKAYESGDPYLYTAKVAGAAPWDATKATHGAVRNQFKATTLGISYGMTKYGLAKKLTYDTGKKHTEDEAQELIELFHDAYPTWSDWTKELLEDYEDKGGLKLPCGWYMFGDNDNRRSVGNCPVQGAGASIMRMAVKNAHDRGLDVIFTLHDALYIEFDAGQMNPVHMLCEAMKDAFKHYLGAHAKIRVDSFVWGEGATKFFQPHKDIDADELYIDGRARKDYEFFRPHLEDTNLLL